MNDATILFLCWRFDGHGWSPKSQKIVLNNWNARSLRPWDSFHFFCLGADLQLLFDLSCLQASISPCLDCVWPGGRISERRFHLRCPEVLRGFQRPKGWTEFLPKRPGFLPFARNEAWTGGECGFWIHHDWTGSYGGKTWEGAVERNELYD